jgi:glyoxylase-like metal-dependent hydrolase (beta-lactamase superfamily II)
MTRRSEVDVTEIETGVFFAQGPNVNWTVLVDGDAFTLVDSGYPRGSALLDRSLAVVRERTGADFLQAILVTHAHSDHIGGLGHLAARFGESTPVLCSPLEVTHVRREVLHQVGLGDVLRHAYDPRIVRWALEARRSGGLDPVGHANVSAHGMDVVLDVPGNPIALATPGHTPGHTAYHLPQHGILMTGDALVSAHPTVTSQGAQTLHPMFNHEQDRTLTTAHEIVTRHQRERFLPGHGPAGVIPRSLDARETDDLLD